MKSWDALACPISLKRAIDTCRLKSRRPLSNLDFIRGLVSLRRFRLNPASLVFQLINWINHRSCGAIRFCLIGHNKEGNGLHGLISRGEHLSSPLKPHGKAT